MVLDAVNLNFEHGWSLKSYRNINSECFNRYETSMEEDPNPSMGEELNPSIQEKPNQESKKFYDLVQAADTKLYLGSSLSQLTVVSSMFNIKMEITMSQQGHKQITELLKEAFTLSENGA